MGAGAEAAAVVGAGSPVGPWADRSAPGGVSALAGRGRAPPPPQPPRRPREQQGPCPPAGLAAPRPRAGVRRGGAGPRGAARGRPPPRCRQAPGGQSGRGRPGAGQPGAPGPSRAGRVGYGGALPPVVPVGFLSAPPLSRGRGRPPPQTPARILARPHRGSSGSSRIPPPQPPRRRRPGGGMRRAAARARAAPRDSSTCPLPLPRAWAADAMARAARSGS